jgi:hypothetical protein
MSSKPSEPDELEESKAKGHEVRDANIPHVLLYGFGMLVLVMIAGVLISGLVYKNMGWFLDQPPATPQYQAGQSELPPAPRLEVQGWRDMKEFREAEQNQLDSYGWVDKSRNIVRIPIGRAMEIIARQGLPARPGGSGPSTQLPAGQGIAVNPSQRGTAD